MKGLTHGLVWVSDEGEERVDNRLAEYLGRLRPQNGRMLRVGAAHYRGSRLRVAAAVTGLYEDLGKAEDLISVAVHESETSRVPTHYGKRIDVTVIVVADMPEVSRELIEAFTRPVVWDNEIGMELHGPWRIPQDDVNMAKLRTVLTAYADQAGQPRRRHLAAHELIRSWIADGKLHGQTQLSFDVEACAAGRWEGIVGTLGSEADGAHTWPAAAETVPKILCGRFPEEQLNGTEMRGRRIAADLYLHSEINPDDLTETVAELIH